MSEFTLRHSIAGENLPDEALSIGCDSQDEIFWDSVDFILSTKCPFTIPHQLAGYDPDARYRKFKD